MKRIEAPFTTRLQKWMKYNMLEIEVYGWEVKCPKSKKYNFNSDKSFKGELVRMMIWYKGVIHKFSDVAMMGTMHDGFCARGRSFFFFTWDCKKVYVIESTLIKELVDMGSTGLTEEGAESIAYLVSTVK